MHRNAKKQKLAIEKTKLDNARRLSGVNFIHTDDEGFTDIMKMRVERWTFRCQYQCIVQLHCAIGKHKTKYAGIDADDSMRKRMEGSPHKNHEDHIYRKRDEFIESIQFGAQIHSYSFKKMKIPDERQQWAKNGKTRENTSMQKLETRVR